MNIDRSIEIQWTAWSVTASLLVILITVVLALVAWRRSGYRRSLGMLELLRVAIVATVAILLNRPEWVEEYRPDESPAVAVLWDASGSMETRDVLPSPGSAALPISRGEAIAPMMNSGSWAGIGDRLEVVLQPIGNSQSDQGTDLHRPIASALESIPNLRAIVLASDGDWNEGPPPVEAAARLRSRGIPLFAVPVGSRDRLPDVEMISFDVPTFGVAGKAVRIPFTIESSLPREYVTDVVLNTSDGQEVSKSVRIAPMGRTTDWILWEPDGIGDFSLALTVPRHIDEVQDQNNRLEAPIAIREERLKVLVIESYPRWEYRFLRNALSRDSGVDVSCLLFQPGLDSVGGGNADYIKEFPDGLDELSKYDVIFLGDVGLDEAQLTSEQCRLIKGLVEFQASGLVFLPGWQGRQFSLLDTELGELCPVVLDPSQPSGWGARTPEHFALTELGRRSLLTKLADVQEENIEIWQGLPGFQWYAPVVRAKAGSDVLCVHETTSNEYGRVPLLVTRTFGAGKVLFMGTDGAWRWRKGVEDRYHYRFWGQVVRWMAYQRNMAAGETMRLSYVPDQPKVDRALTLRAAVMDSGGEPLRSGEVTARITGPSGKADVVRLGPEGEEWGVFTGRFEPGEPGQHSLTLYSQQTGATLDTSFFVQGTSVEPVGKPARPEVLEELARVSGGSVVALDDPEVILQSLAALPEPPPSVRRIPLWSHPAVCFGIIGMAGLFWAGRKAVGLV